MLKVCAASIDAGLVDTTTEWLRFIGMQKQNLRQIRLNTQTFRHDHVLAACDLLGISVDYIYGRTPKMVPFRRSVKKAVSA